MDYKTEQQVLQEIESGADEVRSAGTELANRIKQFEAWLNKVPGRVRADTELSSNPNGLESSMLCFSKDGKGWTLYLYDEHHGSDESRNWTPLRDASLDEKARAVDAFPMLLRAMAVAQRQLVDRLKRTTNEYDDFARSIGIKEGA